MAVGLGSMDMPVPAVAEWEWLNWKFPRPVRAGDTIYATWTLTQKRAPVGGAPTAIVVWRVDVHTGGGALCAEGEIGASVLRKGEALQRISPPGVKKDLGATPVPPGDELSTPAAPPAARRRRRRRPPAGDGAKSAVDSKAASKVEVPAVASTLPAGQERAAGGPRRRRRRRSPGSPQARNGDGAVPATPAELPHAIPAGATPQPARAAKVTSPNPLTRAIRRLRRP